MKDVNKVRPEGVSPPPLAELEELELVFAAVVEASDEFAREQEIREATRRAEDMLAGFAAPGPVNPEDESDRLANHTLAVVEGYRSLIHLYADKA